MIVAGMFIVAVYMVVRYVVYLVMPIPTMMDWFYRDCWMTLPRLGAFLSLYYLNRKHWKAFRFDAPINDLRGLLFPAVSVVFLNAVTLLDSTGPNWPLWTITVGLLTSMVVALCEEYIFRGVLFEGFKRYFSGLTTIFITSFFFTAYHFQAQPLWGWTYLFLMGLIFGSFRARGVGLGWLVLWHGVVDTLWFLFPQYGAIGPSDADLWAYLGLFVVASLACLIPNRPRPEEAR